MQRRSESGRRSRSRRGRRAPAPARSTFSLALAIDAERRVGPCLEPLDGNLLAAVRADPVCAVLDPLQRCIDLRKHVLRVLLERVVELAVVRLCCGVGEMVVERRLLPRLVRKRAGVILLEVLDRGSDALALFEEELAEAVDVERGHAGSLVPRPLALLALRRRPEQALNAAATASGVPRRADDRDPRGRGA